jgi:tRNA dimethylallyltransferase
MENSMRKILIMGVTASGKSSLAFELAKHLGGEIISVDSMKVYRRMDIGTAKPPLEKRRVLPYHLVDVAEPSEAFSVDRYLDLTDKALTEIAGRGKPAVAVGGTAMYIKALLYGLFEGPGTDAEVRARLMDEIERVGLAGLHRRLAEVDAEAASRIHPNDQKRIVRALEVFELTGRPISSFQQQWDAQAMPPEDWCVIGLRRPKEVESSRINLRVKRMMEEGLRDEVAGLLAEEKPLSKQAAAAIGYAEMIEHLKGNMGLEDTVEQIKINTRRFAKAQRTWFKTFRGVNWIDIGEDDTVHTVLERVMGIV